MTDPIREAFEKYLTKGLFALQRDEDGYLDPLINSAWTAWLQSRRETLMGLGGLINKHHVADAFWKYWRENGETHKHGYYESTWGAIKAAIRAAAEEEGK